MEQVGSGVERVGSGMKGVGSGVGHFIRGEFSKFNRHYLEFGVVKTLARMVWGTFALKIEAFACVNPIKGGGSKF